MSTSVLPGYTIAEAGPLTTLFTPPVSCLATTTEYGGQYFIGSVGGLGLDPKCYPHPQTAAASHETTEATKTLKVRDGVTTIQLYSPGICPSGWSYAQSYVPTPARPTTTPVFADPSNEETEFTYFCCPSDYSLHVLAVGPSPTIGVNYPLCTSTGTYVEYWQYTSGLGWPTATLPDGIASSTLEYDIDSGRSQCSSVVVTASGIAVAWKKGDVVEPYVAANVTVPFWPPPYPTSDPYCGPAAKKTYLIGGIGAVIGVLLLWSCLCCCGWMRRRKNKRAGLSGPGAPARRRMFGAGSAAVFRGGAASEEYYPLTNIQQAHVHGSRGSGVHGEAPGAEPENVGFGGEEPPPRYEEAVRDNANLSARREQWETPRRSGNPYVEM